MGLLAAMDGEGVADAVRREIDGRGGMGSARENAVVTGMGPRWQGRVRRAWLRMRGERSDFDPTAAHGARAQLQGFAMGADWVRAERWLLGVAGSYAHAQLALDGVPQSSRVATPHAMAYLAYAGGRWSLTGGGGVARSRHFVQRGLQFVAFGPTGRPLFGGVDRTATSRSSGMTADAWGEGRFEAPLADWSVRGAAGARVAEYRVGAWQESGAGALALAAPPQAFTSVQADTRVELTRRGGRLRPFVSGTYRRELTAGRTATTVQLGESGDGGFTVEGLPLPAASAAGEAGLRVVGENMGMSLSYQLRRADRQVRHVLQLGIGF
jgi:outer membrane autotransporter protein